jgi:hypothetical protein
LSTVTFDDDRQRCFNGCESLIEDVFANASLERFSPHAVEEFLERWARRVLRFGGRRGVLAKPDA